MALAKQLYSSFLKHELAAEAAAGETSPEIVKALSSPKLTVGLLTVAAELAAFACNPARGFLYPQVAAAAGSLGEALVTWTALPVAASALFGSGGGGGGRGAGGGSPLAAAAAAKKSVGTSPAPPPALLDAIHFIAVRLEEEVLFGPGSDLYSAMAAVYGGGASPEMAAAVDAALAASAARLSARTARAARVLSSRTMATAAESPSPADFESKCVGLVNSLMNKR